MAKKSMQAREKRRIIQSARHYDSRATLRDAAKSGDWNAVIALQKRTRDESVTRVQRRCQICARPRGVMRRFNLCRICVREAWRRQFLPGLVKSSW